MSINNPSTITFLPNQQIQIDNIVLSLAALTPQQKNSIKLNTGIDVENPFAGYTPAPQTRPAGTTFLNGFAVNFLQIKG